jgi:CRP-like cAMP-binding protein
MDPSSKDLIGSLALFEGIDPAALEGFARIFRPVSFAPGAFLARQGQPANGAWIIESGTVDALTALPGGGEVHVASLGRGGILGEMALLDAGVRAASAVARTAVTAWFIDRDGFRMLLTQRDRAAYLVQQRITRELCRRLRELNAKIVAADAPENAAPPLSGASADPGAARRGSCPFDWRAFLPILPVFRRFEAEELRDFADRVEPVEVDRGRILFQQGDAGACAYVIVRGALEILRAENGRRHRIGVLGPGRLCGVLALIEGREHSMSAVAREPAVLLEVAKKTFEALFTGSDPVAAKFQDAINRELLQSFARATIHLTRLVSQARIRGGREERKRADDLQRALAEPECRGA